MPASCVMLCALPGHAFARERSCPLSADDITLETNLQFARDFPIPYDIMVENLGDQSHVPFAHHGVAGNR